jgi:hypothetical protein
VPRWISATFAVLLRNDARVTDYLRIPANQVVDIGRQISIERSAQRSSPDAVCHDIKTRCAYGASHRSSQA